MWSTKCIAPPPTAQTTGAIESIFWLEVHEADINGATVAIFEFPSQTGGIDYLLISAEVMILAIWSSFLNAFSHLYKRVCQSVGPSVRRSVGPSVRPSVRPSVGRPQTS